MLKLKRGSLIGMIHVRALPGTPASKVEVARIAVLAAMEARALAEAGFDAMLIENMHDAPYVMAPHDPVIVSAMTAAALAVRAAVPELPLGVQVLARGEREALAVALASGASFIRCENFVFSHVADEGLMVEAAAGPLLRYRRSIGAEDIAIYADIQKKHASHAITGDLPIDEHARGAEFSGADGVIVTGQSTGRPASVSDLELVRGATKLPLLVGSGVDAESVGELLRIADGVIVGSSIKLGGEWANSIDPKRAAALVKSARAKRKRGRV